MSRLKLQNAVDDVALVAVPPSNFKNQRDSIWKMNRQVSSAKKNLRRCMDNDFNHKFYI
jgi:hypothetical protein